MKIKYITYLLIALIGGVVTVPAHAESTRKERKLINKGNSLYNERKFVEATSIYEEALKENSSSAEARYNLGLSQIRQVANPADTTGKSAKLVDAARKNFSQVAALAKTKPGLAAKANFNLGNIEFNAKDFAKAIEFYKQALRIDPNDDKARKNLRIAQKNLQNQNQDKNKNQNQKNKEDQKNKDQNKENNKDQNKDQNQNQNQNNNQKQDKKEEDLSQQAASQILQAIDNKEAATRARVNKANSGDKAAKTKANSRRW